MGIFSSKIKTSVSSTVYNLAGDEDLRPNFLRSTIVGNTLSGGDTGMGEALVSGLLSGSGMRQRSLYRWAGSNYALGVPEASIGAAAPILSAAVHSEISANLALAGNQTLKVISALIDDADVDYWAEDWVRQNRPNLTDEEWTADYDKQTQKILIDLSGEGVVQVSAPADMLWGLNRDGRKLLFAAYTVLTQNGNRVTESDISMYVYRMGSGRRGLDSLLIHVEDMYEFFPVMPLRLENKSIQEDGLEDEYAAVKKAFRKLTTQNVDRLLGDLEEQDGIENIDFAFLVQGISVNEKDKMSKAYLYNFLKGLSAVQEADLSDFYTRMNYHSARDQSMVRWNRWERAHGSLGWYSPGYQSPKPSAPHVASAVPSVTELQITSPGVPDFDFRLRWFSIGESQHNGNGKTFDGDKSRGKMKKGDYWFHVAPDIKSFDSVARWTHPEAEYNYNTRSYSRVFLFHQHSRFRYSRLEIIGMEHKNYVFGGHSVTTTLREALEDEDESGFLIPLHYPTVKDMGLLNSTQLSTTSSYLVLNMYDQYKVKWYQRGIFRFVLAIVTIVITVFFPPGGVGLMSAGLLGTNLAVGTALGFSAATAAVVGGIVNSLAAMVVATIIQTGASKLLGGKWGAIIGTLLSFVAITYGTNYAMTGSFNVDWGSMMRIDNLQQMTDSVGKAYSQWLNADTTEIYESLGNLENEYQEKFDEVKELSDEILGMTNRIIDPIMFTDAAEHFGESSEAFLGRTMLTGSDLAELTQAMIEDFAEISLELPKAVR